MNISKIQKYLFVGLLLCACSCAETNDDQSIVNDNGVVDRTLASASTEWGATKEKLIAHMAGYEQVINSNDFMQFATKDHKQNISYQFSNGKLCATAIILSSVYDTSTLLPDKGKYTLLGQLSGASIYENRSGNTMASVWIPVENDSTHVAVGFAPIISDLYASVSPITVETIGCNNVGMIDATVSGSVSGATNASEIGFIYSTKPDLSETKGRKIEIKGSNNFSTKLSGLLDDETYYYCAYAVIDNMFYLGDIKSFTTQQLTYTIDGESYKFVKVESDGYAYSIMQTELPPRSSIEINGVTYAALSNSTPTSSNSGVAVTKINFMNFLVPLRENTGLDFRLPTMDEWQYAARGGSKTKGYTYSGSNNINDVAWYSQNCSGPQKIAQKKPNELGLYDMSGNYAELCHEYPGKYDEGAIICVDGDMYGGYWGATATNCKPTSMIAGSTVGKVPGTALLEKNAFDASKGTIRLVFIRKKD